MCTCYNYLDGILDVIIIYVVSWIILCIIAQLTNLSFKLSLSNYNMQTQRIDLLDGNLKNNEE